MARQAFLGEFEQMLLLAVLQLDDQAYAPGISRLLEQRASRQVSRGALYSTLDRLEGKGLLRWTVEAASSERAGSRKRRFEVTAKGVQALRSCREALFALWNGLDRVFTRSPQS